MAISLLNNISALEAQNQLNITQSKLQNTLFQLSLVRVSTAVRMTRQAWLSQTACRQISPR